MTDAAIIAAATADERVRAYHCRMPDSVRRAQDAARAWRRAGDHISAGDLERDAAARIRMAQRDALIAIVAARLGMRQDDFGRWIRQ